MDKLKATPNGDGCSLLDNTLIIMGSDIRTAHMRNNVPILFAGGGGGGVQQGQYYVYKETETRLSNLWFGMLKHVGCPVESFSDGSEPLTEIFGEWATVSKSVSAEHVRGVGETSLDQP
jgi:hypothetical protein